MLSNRILGHSFVTTRIVWRSPIKIFRGFRYPSSPLKAFSTSTISFQIPQNADQLQAKIVSDNGINIPENRFTPEEMEAARLARLAGLGWVGKLPEKWIPYAELIRVEKPVGSWLLIFPSFWGVTMASYSVVAPLSVFLPTIVLFAIGSMIMRGSGCIINDILDRDLDRQVARTMERPVASGRVSIPQAVAWLGVQCVAGLMVLLSLPFECFILGAMSLPLISAYPLFKRFTNYPQVMFSICFSWAILVGFPAVGAPLELTVALPLFLSNLVWGVTYDTIYAHQDKLFDINAGIKSTALAWGDRTKPILNGLSVLQAGFYGVAGFMNGMGPGFYLCGLWGFARLFNQIKKVDLDNPTSCWNTFVGNIRTGGIFWLGMLIDYFLLLLGIL